MEAEQGLTGWSLVAASKQLPLIISWQEDRKVSPGSDLKSAEEGTTVLTRGLSKSVSLEPIEIHWVSHPHFQMM